MLTYHEQITEFLECEIENARVNNQHVKCEAMQAELERVQVGERPSEQTVQAFVWWAQQSLHSMSEDILAEELRCKNYHEAARAAEDIKSLAEAIATARLCFSNLEV